MGNGTGKMDDAISQSIFKAQEAKEAFEARASEQARSARLEALEGAE